MTTTQRAAYSPREVADMLGVPYKAVLGLIRDGKLGALRFSRYWRIPADELTRYLNSF